MTDEMEAPQGMARCKIFLAVNEDGGFAVSDDVDDAGEKLDENEAGYQRRVFEIDLIVPLPKASKLEAELPEGGAKFDVGVHPYE